MKLTLLAPLAALGFFAAGAAEATPIAAGGSVTAAVVSTNNTQTLATFNNVAFTSAAPAGQTSTFSGTYSTSVFRDSNNNLCGVAGSCLTFSIQVTNSSTSRDGIETVTTGPFSNLFSYNVGYTPVAGDSQPLYINDSAFGAISFNFTSQGNTGNIIAAGKTSDLLLIQTSATNYQAGNISFQDSQTATVAGFIPAAATISAAPEPGTWALMMLGVGATGLMLRRRRQLGSLTAA